MVEVLEGQRSFTVEQYHRMGEAGVFGPEERVELIRGVIGALREDDTVSP